MLDLHIKCVSLTSSVDDISWVPHSQQHIISHDLLSLTHRHQLRAMQYTTAMLKYHRQLYQGEQPPMPNERTTHPSSTRHHHQCGLVRLPRETRFVIYQHLLADGAVASVTLIKGKSFRTIGIPGASLLRTCKIIFNELNPTVAALRDVASLDIRVVDTMAIPRAPRSMRDLTLEVVRKISVRIMLSQLTEKAVVLRGLSLLIKPISKGSNIQELHVTVSATRSYTDQAPFDELVAWLSNVRTKAHLELCWENTDGYRPVAKRWGALGVNTAGFIRMRSDHLKYVTVPVCRMIEANVSRRSLAQVRHQQQVLLAQRDAVNRIMGEPPTYEEAMGDLTLQ